MFKRDSQGNLYYESENKIDYSLLVGMTDKNMTSDVLFVFREPTEDNIDNGFTGEVVDFVYGGFSDIDVSDKLQYIEMRIKEYEKTHLTK